MSLEPTGNESTLNKPRSAFPGNRRLQPIFAIARVNEEQCPPDSATHAAAASGREKGILSCGNAEVRGANEQKCLKYTGFSWLFSINIIKIYFHIFSASSLNPVTSNFSPLACCPLKNTLSKEKCQKGTFLGFFWQGQPKRKITTCHPQSGFVLVGLPLFSIDWYWQRFLSLKLEATRLTQQAFKV